MITFVIIATSLQIVHKISSVTKVLNVGSLNNSAEFQNFLFVSRKCFSTQTLHRIEWVPIVSDRQLLAKSSSDVQLQTRSSIGTLHIAKEKFLSPSLPHHDSLRVGSRIFHFDWSIGCQISWIQNSPLSFINQSCHLK